MVSTNAQAVTMILLRRQELYTWFHFPVSPVSQVVCNSMNSIIPWKRRRFLFKSWTVIAQYLSCGSLVPVWDITACKFMIDKRRQDSWPQTFNSQFTTITVNNTSRDQVSQDIEPIEPGRTATLGDRWAGSFLGCWTELDPSKILNKKKKKIVPRIPGQLKQTDTNWTDRLNQGVQTGGGDEERPKRTKTNTAWLTLIDAQSLRTVPGVQGLFRAMRPTVCGGTGS